MCVRERLCIWHFEIVERERFRTWTLVWHCEIVARAHGRALEIMLGHGVRSLQGNSVVQEPLGNPRPSRIRARKPRSVRRSRRIALQKSLAVF